MTDSVLPESTAVAPVIPRSRWNVWNVLLQALHFYPVLLVGALYATWFAGWIALGHAPVPSLDDPKYIGLLVDVPYWVFMALMTGAPAAFVAGAILLPLVLTQRTAVWRLRFALVSGWLWVLVFLFLAADPWDVANWYAD